MLQVARLAPRLLRDSTDVVAGFLRSQCHERGGFCNRSGEPDLYYTVFGLEGLIALQIVPSASAGGYLGRFGDGASLDLVHLSCLARCWADVPGRLPGTDWREAVARRLETFRAADGGYHASPGAQHGTVYGSFLAAGAYQDLGLALPDPDALLRSIRALRAADGGYANMPGATAGSVPATAAAVMLLRLLDGTPEASLAFWLLARCRPEGGFFASPAAPVPDLLSTATALHALVAMHASIDAIKEPSLDFIDTLWSSRGGFCGSWADEAVDCEYTYYALLALGHLSL